MIIFIYKYRLIKIDILYILNKIMNLNFVLNYKVIND